jgi:hypothetical protein
MSYSYIDNDDYAKLNQPEPCARIPNPELAAAIKEAEQAVDSFLTSLRVATVPLTTTDITVEFKNAVLHWVVAVAYLNNNNVDQGTKWRQLARNEIKEFVSNHKFLNTTKTEPGTEPQVYQYTDDITDMQEPRDV